MNHVRELAFQSDFLGIIKVMGGRGDLIESRKSPGNSDILYTLDAARGLLELKRSVYFKMDNKIRLVHPVKTDQHNFLNGHNKFPAAGPVLISVLFTKNDRSKNHAAVWAWSHWMLVRAMPLREALEASLWHGPWPPRGPLGRTDGLRQALTEW